MRDIHYNIYYIYIYIVICAFGFGNNNFGCPRTGQPRPSESHFHTSPGVPRSRARGTDWRDSGSVATGQRSCQQAALRHHAVSEPIGKYQ